MFGNFYNSSLRRYIVLMGDLFSKVNVARVKNNKVSYIKVPITYASKERFFEKINNINNVNNNNGVAKIDNILPRMNLHMINLQYNAEYKTYIQNRTLSQDKDSKLITQYNPVPYKMTFELNILTRYQDDMFQIIEQIVPYFQPHFTVNLTELHDNDISIPRKIRVLLQDIMMDESVDTDRNTPRRIEWTIMFEVNGYIYPPSAEIKGEIRTVYLDFFNNSINLDSDVFESVDAEIVPRNASEQEWNDNPTIEESYSKNIPIPKGDETGVRKNG